MDSAPHRTLELAELSMGLCEPNPRVGCVIVCPDGRAVEGHTQQAGGPHAEAHALLRAREQGIDVRGATAWVSLEPCSHQGRTPPCSQALIDAGIRTVHVAITDPNPLVGGQGLEHLRRNGVQVHLHDDEWSACARELNIGFLSRMQRARPWVRMKIAASMDGATALLNGRSQWITAADSRRDGHAWRRRAGAILTGIGTIREDDPRLDVRLVPTAMQPMRVVVDSRLEISAGARVLQPPGRCLIYTTDTSGSGADTSRAMETRQSLQALPQVEIAALPTESTGPSSGKTDLQALMADLARRGVNELHVEAGEKLNGSLLRSGCVDEILLYQAPRLLGRGRGLADFAGSPLESLDQGIDLRWLEVRALEADLRLRALTAQGQSFWRAVG